MKTDQIKINQTIIDYVMRKSPPAFELQKLARDLISAIHSFSASGDKNIVVTMSPEIFHELYAYFDTNPNSDDLMDLKRHLIDLIGTLIERNVFWAQTKDALNYG